MADPHSIEPVSLLEQRLNAVIAAVVIRSGHHIHASVTKELQHFRACTVVIRCFLSFFNPLFASGGDHAFEVDHTQVGI